jgi:HK97 family phage major capsid protein
MDKWLTQRAELLRSAKSLIDARKSADQALSDGDRAHLHSVEQQVEALDAKIDAARKDAHLVEAFKSAQSGPVTPGSQGDGSHGDDQFDAKSIGPDTARSVARQLVKSATTPDGVKAIIDGGTGTSDLVLGLSALPQVPQNLLAAIPQVQLASPPTYRYLRQTVRTSNAAVVAAGAEKPVSPMSLSEIDGRLRVIAHLSEPIGVYTLQDVATLAGFVQGELNWGLFTALEQQVISGNGTGENMTGLLNTSGVLTQAFGADLLATLRSAITKVESTGFTPAVIALSPADWETIETSQTSGSGEYLFASSPVDRAARKVWGVQVALSTALPAGKAVLLSRDTVSLYTDGRIAYDLDKSQGFSTNEVVARLEGRWDLAVQRPSGVVAIDTAASGG